MPLLMLTCMWLQSIITVNFGVNEATREVSLLLSDFSDVLISTVGRSVQSVQETVHSTVLVECFYLLYML